MAKSDPLTRTLFLEAYGIMIPLDLDEAIA